MIKPSEQSFKLPDDEFLKKNNDKITGQIKIDNSVYKITLIKDINNVKQNLLNQLNKYLPIIRAFKNKSNTVSISSSGTIERIYRSSKTGRIKFKRYSTQNLLEKLAKTSNKLTTAELMRKIYGLGIAISMKDGQSQDPISNFSVDILNVDLKKDSGNNDKLAEKDKIEVIHSNFAKSALIGSLLFDEVVIVPSMNRKKDDLIVEEKEYAEALNQIKLFHGNANTKDLDKIIRLDLPNRDMYGGDEYCFAMTLSFVTGLGQNPTPSEILSSASKCIEGLEDKQSLVIDTLLRHFSLTQQFSEDEISVLSGTNDKNMSQVEQKELLFTLYFANLKPISEPFGINFELTSIQHDKIDTTNLSPGKYLISLRSLSSPKKIMGIELPLNLFGISVLGLSHSIAYVKNNDHTSCLFDPNFGLIFCKNDEEVVEKFKLLKSLYKAGSYNPNLSFQIMKIKSK